MSKRCLGCMELFGDEFSICPHCGYVVDTPVENPVHIEPGTLLNDRYIIGKVLGYGGFGVTYIGWDGRLEQKVAIKEYFPSEFSTRMPGQSQVTVFNGEKNEQFYDGLKKFVEEAKHLAKFQNEDGIVKIFDSFIENDTAYIIMEYLEGETLKEYLKREKTIPEDEAVEMLMPVMKSLQVVHEVGLIHRDIAPDNIFLTTSGEVKLIDFGASRYATTSHSRSLTVIIKPGFSPEEQYRSRGDQGPHTDVYAIAATLYKMITGKTPPDAMERRAKYENQNKEILEEPHKINKEISVNRENAILNAMNVRIEDRTPDIATLIHDLNADPPVKRKYGKIKKIDIYSWPLWVKIGIPALLSVVITFGVLILTGVIKFSKFTEEIIVPDNVVSVPDVEGMFKEEALSTIEQGQLLASTDGTIESDYIPAGKIILQTPVSGSYMDVNSTVKLMVSSGKGVQSPIDGQAVIPYVVWDTKDDAVAKLLQAGLAEPEIIEEYDENVTAGSVIAQSVEAGTKVDVGTVIKLTVSVGARSFEMPNVVGSMIDAAQETLNSKGLVVTVEYKKTDEAKEGTVIAQNVASGTSVKRGDKIIITVCSGRETIDVADVTGMPEKDAVDKLKEQGFKVTVLENYDSKVEKGIVISQSPTAGTAQLPDSTVVIYVSKGKQPVTVTYDANMGSVNADNKTVYLMDKYGDLPIAERTGYTFNGWYNAKNGGDKITSETMVSTSSNHTLYAQWTANTYVLSFNANGGNVALTSQNITYGNMYGELPVPIRTGYGFKGWYTDKTGGTQITGDMTYTVAGNQTLYAQWGNNSYKITFNPNGGNVSVTEKEVSYSSNYGDMPTPTRTGYDFMGWYTAKDGGDKITSSSKVMITASQTLYARWSNSNSNVVFDVNGGMLSETGITVTYGKTYGKLPVPTRDGYTFKGWYTDKTGGTEITSSTKVTITAKQTLYARWMANSYKVAYNANGGTCEVTDATVVYDQTYGTLPVATRTGYTFNGWYTAKTGGNIVSSGDKVNILTDITLYAQWTANSYKVSYDANGGTCGETETSVTYDQVYGTLPSATRPGYTFNGWYTAKEGGTEITASTMVTIISNQTLYAHWTANQYKLVFDGNGGTSDITEKYMTYGGTVGDLPTASRTGHTFNGSYTASVGGDIINSDTRVTTLTDMRVYAHWTPNNYTYDIVYKSSTEVVLQTSTVTHAYGTTNTINPIGIAGYNTPNAQNVTWDSVNAKTITFTYTPKSYTYNVSYVSSNGTNLGGTQVTYLFGTTNTITAPAKAGYDTPGAQSVKWDSESKPITFTYTPSAVGEQPQVSNVQWCNDPVMCYTIFAEYQNRTATSVQVKVHCSTNIVGNKRNKYGQKLRVSYGSIASEYVHLTAGAWGTKVSYLRTQNGASEWITIPLNTTNAIELEVGIRLYQINSIGDDCTYLVLVDGTVIQCDQENTTLKINIPAY